MTNLIVRFFLSLQSYHFAFIKKIIPDKKTRNILNFMCLLFDLKQ